MTKIFWLPIIFVSFSTVALDREVYYYGWRGEPVVLQRIDDGSAPWPVVSYGASPMPLTGRIGVKYFGEEKISFLAVKPGADPFETARRLTGEPGTEWAQPEWLIRIKPLGIPNDPYFPNEWHIAQAAVAQAWETTVGTSHTLIALVDSGVDFAHPDLAENLEEGTDLTGHDNPGCDRPVSVSNDQIVAAHGTCVAGIIGAIKDNELGVVGVCPSCALFPTKLVRYDELTIPASRIYDAIVAAVDAGADVINNSWGEEDSDAAGNCVSVPLDSFRAEAVRYAKEKGRNGRGALVVWAAGNSSCDTSLNANLSLPDIIVVSALDANGKQAWYSNFGNTVTFCAGAANWTTDITGEAGFNNKRYVTPEGNLDYTNQFSGTSAAAAVVSGIAGLMYAANPLLSFAEAHRCLRLAAKRPPTTTCAAGEWSMPMSDPYAPTGKEHSPCFGYGIPDASVAVIAARDGTCGTPYAGCDNDTACGSGFLCDETTRECYKKPLSSPSSGGGCTLLLAD